MDILVHITAQDAQRVMQHVDPDIAQGKYGSESLVPWWLGGEPEEGVALVVDHDGQLTAGTLYYIRVVEGEGVNDGGCGHGL